MIETPDSNLRQIIQNVNTSYTVYVNRRHGRVGHLYQGRYKAFVVEKEGYLLELGRYIQLNPVRVGLVRRPEDYRWSSYREYIGDRRRNGLVDTDETLGYFSSKRILAMRKYRGFIREGLKGESPLDGAVGSILGDEGFRDRVLIYLKGISDKTELPDLKRVIPRPEVEEIIGKTANYYKINEEDLLRRRRATERERAVAIYLCRELSGRGNREIGKIFGITLQAVTNAVRRVERLGQIDKGLAKEVESIKKMLNI